MLSFVSSVIGWIPAPLVYVMIDEITKKKDAGPGNNEQTGESRIPMAVFFYITFVPVILSIITTIRLKHYKTKLVKKKSPFHTGYTTLFL